jgi:hypothetical protein
MLRKPSCLVREHLEVKLTLHSSNTYSPLQDRYGIRNTFYPLEGMRRDDADTALILLGTSVKYTKPVDDPWFSAHKLYQQLDAATGENLTLYLPDSPVSLMSCTVQVFCPRFANP